MSGQYLLQMRSISKSFPGVQALNRVDFDLQKGEIHALVGENGAGKSTLIKILAGAYIPDEGKIEFKGQTVTIDSPVVAQNLGIAIVHQETNLFPSLSVAENIFAGRQPVKGHLTFIDKNAMWYETRKLLQLFNVRIHPETKIQELSVGQRQIVEIAKALSLKAEILILDEPTSALTQNEVNLLFNIIDELRNRGLGIIYISHRLEEIFKVSDRITVLRDGQKVGTIKTPSASPQQIINMMVGRQLNDFYGQRLNQPGEAILSVSNLSLPGKFYDISLSLRRGEILGFAGLIGSGRTDVALALFGYQPALSGELWLEGKKIWPRSPREAMRLGIAYVSEDRREKGLFTSMSLRDNISVTQLRRLSRWGLMDMQRENAAAIEMISRLRIRTPTIMQKVLNLSGGNQQKVALAKWLALNPKVLIVDEPTRGVDVGAKAEIYGILRSLAKQGVAVLMISSELPEILGLSDRILVMHEGRLAGEVLADKATEELIMTYAAGQGSVKIAN
ncbi:Ribose import ATP-binding protein RbsA [Neomoorella glycerini]|uniref:Ribose import ATP-binding protein RbsA n=1 Tax=Neomoorella glycerini TaxID=55779 RepID=A0A6I5ZSK7_9FIRM|nr:sugar ABC transporter ATP-binding protein [Moorella glycerini]QGP92537.1 Ribose import ATP-binding protein RbsA [Moorella glycerini]